MWHRRNLGAKESGLECTCVNNDDFTVLVSGGSRCHWVSMCTVQPSHSKWASRATNLHEILCYVSTFLCRNYSDNSESCSYGQLVIGSFTTTTCPLMCHILSGASMFFGETSNHPGDLAPYSPHLAPCDFRLLLKLKLPLKGNRFQTINELQENMMGQLMVIGRTVWVGPKVPTLKVTEVSWLYVQCFLYLVSSSVNVSSFHYMAGYFLDRLWYVYMYVYVCICQILTTHTL